MLYPLYFFWKLSYPKDVMNIFRSSNIIIPLWRKNFKSVSLLLFSPRLFSLGKIKKPFYSWKHTWTIRDGIFNWAKLVFISSSKSILKWIILILHITQLKKKLWHIHNNLDRKLFKCSYVRSKSLTFSEPAAFILTIYNLHKLYIPK